MIRRLNKNDISDYFSLRLEMLQLVPTAFGMSFEEERAKGPSFFESVLSATEDSNVIFGAFLNGKLVGSVGVVSEKGLKRKHKATIWGMYVQSTARGQGLGKSLVKAAIEHAKSKTGSRIIHLSVESTNKAAKALYSTCGFQVWGLEPQVLYVGNAFYDEYHMFLDLNNREPKPNLSVRMASEEDAKAILEAHHGAVHETASKDYTSTIIEQWSAPVNEERIKSYLNKSFPQETTVVAELNGEVIGFGAIVDRHDELRAIYVLPTAGRIGAGSAILNRLEEIARARGIKELKLDSSLTAEPFYLKHGYQVVERGEHKMRTGLKMPCVKMRKVL